MAKKDKEVDKDFEAQKALLEAKRADVHALSLAEIEARERRDVAEELEIYAKFGPEVAFTHIVVQATNAPSALAGFIVLRPFKGVEFRKFQAESMAKLKGKGKGTDDATLVRAHAVYPSREKLDELLDQHPMSADLGGALLVDRASLDLKKLSR